MKKAIALLVVLALSLCMNLTAFAGENGSKDVKGTYVSGGTEATVYSVDVTWGSMEFTYTSAFIGVWNPATHEYDNPTDAKWECAADANKVTVTNHSNTAVTTQLNYVANAGFNVITGTFSPASISLGTAVGTAQANAPAGSSLLTLTGDLAQGTAASSVIGAVTVTLSE